MKSSRSIRCTAAFLTLFFAVQFGRSSTRAQVVIPGATRQLTTDPAPQVDPAISGDLVVYTDQRNGNDDVYVINVVTGVETRITTATTAQRLNDVSGNLIALTDLTSPSRKVMLYDVVTGVTTQAGTGTVDQNPRLVGNLVAFERGLGSAADVWAFDRATNTEIPVATGPNIDLNPVVGGTRVVYERHATTSSQGDIVLFDIATSTETVLEGTASDARRPDIDGNIVVWDVLSGPNNTDIAIHDLSTGATQVLALTGNQRSPHVSGLVVAYDDDSAGNPGVMLYRIPSGQFEPVTTSTDSHFLSDISGDRVVYTSNQAGNNDIWLYEFALDRSIEIAPNTIQFGSVNLGSTQGRLVTVSNLDNQALSVQSVSLDLGSNGFSVAPLSLPLAIPVGGSKDIGVTFAPPAGGSVSDTLRITTSLGSFQVPLAGQGVVTSVPQGVFRIRGGGDLDWVPTTGAFGPMISSYPTSASGTISGPNGSASYSIAAGPGVVRGSLGGLFTSVGRFNPSLQADATSELTLIGPVGFLAIPVTLNLHVDSTVTVEQCPDLCNISVGVLGHGGITRFSIESGFTANGLGLIADPIPGGYHLHGDVATPEFPMTPNLTTSVGITLQINDNNLNRGFGGASIFAVGPTNVSFAPNGPVLNGVPSGYTVTGPSVVNNHWTDPLGPDIELRLADGTTVESGDSLDLGTISSGTTSAPGIFRILNTGFATLHVTDVNAPAEFHTDGGSVDIAPGSSQEISVTCAATNTTADPLTVDGQIVVQSDDPDEPSVNLPVRCTVLPAPLTGQDIELRFADGTPMPASNAVVDLGDVAAGGVRPGAYRIANVGDATLEVTDITHDTPAPGIAIAPSTSASIEPGGSLLAPLGCGGPNPNTTPVNVEFAVFVHSNDPDEASAQFTVRCRVLPAAIVPPPPSPDIELRYVDGTPIPDPVILDLGDVASGAVKNKYFQIGNVGDVSLLIADFQADPADGDIRPSGIDHNTVLAGAGTLAQITCQGVNTAETPSLRTTTVSIVSNDPDEGTIHFTVHCTILSASAPDIALRDINGHEETANGTIDLGTVSSDVGRILRFSVHNTGPGPSILHIQGITLTTPVYPDFGNVTFDNYASLNIASGDDRSLSIYCGGHNLGDTPHIVSFPFSINSDDPDENPLSFTVTCTVLPETIPPTIAATATPGPNVHGWNRTNVTVSYSCTDAGSGVNQAASALGNDVLTASGTATGTCVDNAGNQASTSYTAQIDKTAPAVGYAGNTGTYSVVAAVAITCSAFDPVSGIASSNCANASGPAWSFGAGPHTLSASATDRAGNIASASTTFTVNVNPSGLTTLTRQFVQSSANYQALRLGQRAAVDAIVTAACNILLNVSPTTTPAQKAQLINAYRQAVQALVAPGWLTASQATTLKALANAI